MHKIIIDQKSTFIELTDVDDNDDDNWLSRYLLIVITTIMTMISMNVLYDDDHQWLSYIAVTNVDDDDDDQY